MEMPPNPTRQYGYLVTSTKRVGSQKVSGIPTFGGMPEQMQNLFVLFSNSLCLGVTLNPAIRIGKIHRQHISVTGFINFPGHFASASFTKAIIAPQHKNERKNERKNEIKNFKLINFNWLNFKLII